MTVNEIYPYLLIILGFVVLILAIYLGFLYNELAKQKRKREAIQAQLLERRRKRDSGIYESLRIIGLAVLQNQCEVSEGCIRIHKLISLLDESDFEKKQEYDLFEELYLKLKPFAYLEAREQLSKQEKYDQDKERFAVEDEYRDRMVASCKVLVEHVNQLQT